MDQHLESSYKFKHACLWVVCVEEHFLKLKKQLNKIVLRASSWCYEEAFISIMKFIVIDFSTLHSNVIFLFVWQHI